MTHAQRKNPVVASRHLPRTHAAILPTAAPVRPCRKRTTDAATMTAAAHRNTGPNRSVYAAI